MIPATARISRVDVAAIPSRPMRSSAASYSRVFASPAAIAPTFAFRTARMDTDAKNAVLALSRGPGLSSRCRRRCNEVRQPLPVHLGGGTGIGQGAGSQTPQGRRLPAPIRRRDGRDRANLPTPKAAALSPSRPRGPDVARRPTVVRMDDYSGAVRSRLRPRPTSRGGRSRCSAASGCCTGTCRTGSGCRWSTKAGPARRWRRSRSSSGWARARCTRSAPSSAFNFADGNVPDDHEEPPARHRRAAPVHGLPVPRSTTRTTASSSSRTAARSWTSSRWARSTSGACATRSRTRRSTRPPARPIRTARSARSTARRACPPTRCRTAAGPSSIDPTSIPVCPAPQPRARRSVAHREHRRGRRPKPASRAGGWDDYDRDFDPDFQLEDFSHRALVVALQEFAVQSHLLFRSFLLTVAQRFGEEEAARINPMVFTGLAGLTAQRLRTAMNIDGDDADGDRQGPAAPPASSSRGTYVDIAVEVGRDDRVRFAILDSPVFAEARRLPLVRAARWRERPWRSTRSCRP